MRWRSPTSHTGNWQVYVPKHHFPLPVGRRVSATQAQTGVLGQVAGVEGWFCWGYCTLLSVLFISEHEATTSRETTYTLVPKPQRYTIHSAQRAAEYRWSNRHTNTHADL